MYQFIPLHPCDYLKKISIKINLAIEEGKSRNEIWQWTNDEIRVAVQSWLWGLLPPLPPTFWLLFFYY